MVETLRPWSRTNRGVEKPNVLIEAYFSTIRALLYHRRNVRQPSGDHPFSLSESEMTSAMPSRVGWQFSEELNP